MYSTYIRWHGETRGMEGQTRTGDAAAALTAFRALLGRRDLDGEKAGVVLRDQARGRTLLFSRFDMPDQQLLPDDPIGSLDRAWVDADSDTRAIVAARSKAPAPDDSFGALLERYRVRRGLTEAQCAARWGVPLPTFKGWKGGKPAGNAGAIGRVLLLELDGPAQTGGSDGA